MGRRPGRKSGTKEKTIKYFDYTLLFVIIFLVCFGLAVLLVSVCQWCRKVAGLAAATAMGQGSGAKTKVSHSPVAGRMADCDSYGLKLLLNLLGVMGEYLLFLSGFGLGHLDFGE